MKNVVYVIWCTFIFIILIYAVLKEREELGCYRISIAQQCIDDESVYIKGTKSMPDDTTDVLKDRVISALSYHDKGGVWKRCLIIATLIIVVIVLFEQAFCDRVAKWITLHVILFTILYFYFNYLNYHHFRNLKKNGVESLSLLMRACKLN